MRVGGVQLSREQRHCPQHGAYTAYSLQSHKSGKPDYWSGCVQCLALADQKNLREAIIAQRREQQESIWKKRLGRAAIPQRFADRSLQNYVPPSPAAEKALRICIDFADNFDAACQTGRSLVFCGNVGTGKTHLACGIARQVMAQGRQAVFSSVLRAVRMVKDTYHRDSKKTEDQVIQELTEPDLLILDEIGVQFGSDTEKMLLSDIINSRYELIKPSILISNLGLQDLDDYLGSRVMDRLREGGGKAIVFDWGSYRKMI